MIKKFKIYILLIITLEFTVLISPKICAETLFFQHQQTALSSLLEKGTWFDSPTQIQAQKTNARCVAISCFENKQSKDEKAFFIEEIPLSKELQKYIFDLCEEKNIDYDLVLSVIKCESNFNINSVGYNTNGTYDSGLMQINSCHLKSLEEEYGINDIMNPYQNLLVGINLISNSINNYGEIGGLVAYNMGTGGYISCLSAGNLNTQYVQKVKQAKDLISSMEHI